MYKLFSIAGYNKKQVEEKFGGMLNALSYGLLLMVESLELRSNNYVASK